MQHEARLDTKSQVFRHDFASLGVVDGEVDPCYAAMCNICLEVDRVCAKYDTDNLTDDGNEPHPDDFSPCFLDADM